MKAKRRLEIIIYLALILLCSILLIKRLNNSSSDIASSPNLKVGDQYESLKAIVSKNFPATLVLILSPECPFCERNMPFFRKLIQQKNSNFSVIAAVAHESILESQQRALEEADVNVDALVKIDVLDLKITKVPTLILADKKGKVIGFWEGYLNENQQEEVLKASKNN